MTTTTKAGPGLYLPSLDGLRTVAFLLVFMHHNPPAPVQMGLAHVQRQGWAGVELFFAISAFLFFHLFRAEYERAGAISVSAFLLRRVLRLYPLLIAFSAAMAIYGLASGAVPVATAAGRFLGFAGLFDNLLIWVRGYSEIPFTPHLWTIAYEFQIYLFMPAAYGAFVKWGRTRFLYGLLAVWIFALLARLTFVLLGAIEPIWVTPFLRPESTLIGLAMSVGLFTRLKAPLVIAVGAAAVLALGFAPRVGVGGLASMYIYPLVAIACGALLWMGVYVARVSRGLAVAPLRYLGKISYGLYVFHPLAIFIGWKAAVALNLRPYRPGEYLESIGLALVLCIAASAASYRLLEGPFLKMKQRRAIVTGRAV
jgi:peptidoglycan/LPS O-acetylase OafA/YrhL